LHAKKPFKRVVIVLRRFRDVIKRSRLLFRAECVEPLAVGVCVLARELGALDADDVEVDGRELLLYRNTCPTMLVPARKLTLTRLLQLMANFRAEAASRSLIAAILSAAPADVRGPDTEEAVVNAKPPPLTLTADGVGTRTVLVR
jgi:hypothetical protein